MQVFKVSRKVDVVCEASKTRNGFKHEATLVISGQSRNTVKCNYQNRTWESFTYQTVLDKLLDQVKDEITPYELLTPYELRKFKHIVKHG